jgi:peptidyl-tRNA hydrolase
VRWQIQIQRKSIFLLKPNTYMNLSGKAVYRWKENIPLENLLVITDDLIYLLALYAKAQREVTVVITA